MNKDLQTIAKRYAVALFELGKEQNSLPTLEEEMKVLKQVFEANKELLGLLENPKVDKVAKKALVTETFQSFSLTVQNTLHLIVERHRQEIIPVMAAYVLKLSNEARNEKEALVYSTRLLTEDEKTAISEVFSKKVNANKLHIENIVDDSILGGVKIRIGNTIFDGTLSGKLERIRRQLTASRS